MFGIIGHGFTVTIGVFNIWINSWCKGHNFGSSRFCLISLTYNMIDLCVLCVFVVRSTPLLGVMYLRIYFTHQTWESLISDAAYLSEN
ncbi:MAG: hypothetical protein EWV92_02440 [Microcystis aeruginosa Ma_MB_S_20031200_S102]|uniref:Uncharacterized protein n=1 Tax=Microcystis aeruginosa Ma_MB_S_20031200_S102 TaxID=2486254 RepID=A0A552F5J8_MICAE|nr:MAG: hypothetical protein EWV79_00205 [Microcystis aeruginosa Ma_MB_S_20031200_S102D]TRU41992.1 MAG: hypothetical protein EWV92_02440 [Microcystis aeruginosa Ma_MB_S_20031200_S102]